MGSSGSKTYKVKGKENIKIHLNKSRSLTPFVTNQGTQGSCYAHSTSKLVIKNIYENCISLKLTKKEESVFSSCLSYLKTDVTNEITQITSEKCGNKGYYKILLFLFNYFTMTDKYDCEGGNLPEALNYLVEKIYNPIIIPKRFNQSFHLPILTHLLEKIQKKMNNVSCEIIEVLRIPHKNDKKANKDFNDITTKIIIFIEMLLDAGLYVNLIFHDAIERSPSYIKKYGRSGHSVNIVDYKDNSDYELDYDPDYDYKNGTFIIKNSWGKLKNKIRYMDMNEVVFLDEKLFKVNSIVCILPILKGMKRYDGNSTNNVTYKEIWEREIDNYGEWLKEYVILLKKSKWIKN